SGRRGAGRWHAARRRACRAHRIRVAGGTGRDPRRLSHGRARPHPRRGRGTEDSPPGGPRRRGRPPPRRTTPRDPHRGVRVTALLVAILLIAGNAFFVAGEFSLISARRTVLEPMAATSRRAAMALSAMSQIPLAIAGAQLGVTICSLGLGAIAEPAIAHL